MATKEAARVLKPDGIAVIQTALFPSLQGGHHPDWHDLGPDPWRTTRPWDHLQTGAKALPTYCNGWSAIQYRVAFEERFVIVRWEEGEVRGAGYLTDELRAILKDYTERDLLTPYVTMWGRKRDE